MGNVIGNKTLTSMGAPPKEDCEGLVKELEGPIHRVIIHMGTPCRPHFTQLSCY